jgi:hypothetical protein
MYRPCHANLCSLKNRWMSSLLLSVDCGLHPGHDTASRIDGWVAYFYFWIVDYTLCILMLDASRLSYLFGCNNKVLRYSISLFCIICFIHCTFSMKINPNRPRRTECIGPLGAPPEANGQSWPNIHFRVCSPTQTETRSHFFDERHRAARDALKPLTQTDMRPYWTPYQSEIIVKRNL